MLRRRIHRQAAGHRQAQQEQLAPMLAGHPDPSMTRAVAADMPTAIVGYVPWANGGYGTLTMEEADVMWGADGAPYLATPATGPSWDAGRGWGTTVAAGNPRQGAASETKARAQNAAPAFTPQAAGPQQPAPPLYAADGAPYGTSTAVYRGPGR